MVNQKPFIVQISDSMFIYLLPMFYDPSTTFTQVTQQIYVVKEWVKNSREKVNVEIQSRLVAKKVAGVFRQEKESLAEKVKEAIQARDSAEAGLKTMERQAEDMHQKLHVTEVNLATEEQAVLDLKTQL